MARVQQGSVIWARVDDQTGGNPKCRPAVVVTPSSEIVPNEKIVIVAATGTFTLPLPENCVDLPWKAGGHPTTKLFKRCVAVCNWLLEIEQSQIESVGGRVPIATLNAILDRIPGGAD